MFISRSSSLAKVNWIFLYSNTVCRDMSNRLENINIFNWIYKPLPSFYTCSSLCFYVNSIIAKNQYYLREFNRRSNKYEKEDRKQPFITYFHLCVANLLMEEISSWKFTTKTLKFQKKWKTMKFASVRNQQQLHQKNAINFELWFDIQK